MRNATVTRSTKETKISLTLELDGKGNSEIQTGVGFLESYFIPPTASGRL